MYCQAPIPIACLTALNQVQKYQLSEGELRYPPFLLKRHMGHGVHLKSRIHPLPSLPGTEMVTVLQLELISGFY